MWESISGGTLKLRRKEVLPLWSDRGNKNDDPVHPSPFWGLTDRHPKTASVGSPANIVQLSMEYWGPCRDHSLSFSDVYEVCHNARDGKVASVNYVLYPLMCWAVLEGQDQSSRPAFDTPCPIGRKLMWKASNFIILSFFYKIAHN